MLRYAVLLAFLTFVFAAPEFPRNGNNIHLDVYYESRCPDSRNFLVKQLAANWPALSTYMDVRLVPFGKATFEANPEGGWSFDCQHGPEECSGNILHACGIKYSRDTTQALNFTSCLMKSPNAGEECAEKANLDYEVIKECHESLEGQELVHEYGVETLSLNPKLTFVPWIVMDKVWDDKRQWGSIFNLKETSCKYINFKAAACSNL